MRIMIVGDTHGSSAHWKYIAKKIRPLWIDAIVQVGDFGFLEHWPGGKGYLDKVNTIAGRLGKTVYWVDGNHENFDQLYYKYTEFTSDGFRIIRPNVLHIPRAHTWEWDGVRFMGLGGGYSIDQMSRVVDEMNGGLKAWWPQELITDEEVDRAKAAGRVDVMFTHDVPEGNQGLQEAFIQQTGRRLIPEFLSAENRRQLRRVFNAVKPQILFHGHYHIRYNGELNGCKIIGLAHNGAAIPTDSWYVLDTEDITPRATNPA